MNVLRQSLVNLPGLVLEGVERDVGEPVRNDYEIECGGQSGGAMDSDVDSFVLLTVNRGGEAIIEVNLTPDQARLMAAKLVALADNAESIE